MNTITLEEEVNTITLRSVRQLVLLFLAGLTSCAVLAADDDKDKKRFENVWEWERAAMNRELAAYTQESQAEELLECAQEFRKKAYLYDKEKKSNFNNAGDNEMKAGDLEAGASLNFEQAAANWERVANEYKELHDEKKLKDAKTMAALARENALLAPARAANAYELAAEAYGKNNADEPAKAAAASEKAAVQREKLAGRK